MAAGDLSTKVLIPPNLLFSNEGGRARKFWAIQGTIIIVFLLYAALLFHVPALWTNQPPSSSLKGSIIENNSTSATTRTLDYGDLKNNYSASTRSIALEIWFGLGLMPGIDAATVVASRNRRIIDNWHYFVSVRMMAVASLASFIVLLSGNRDIASFISQNPVIVGIVTLIIYAMIGFWLDRFHAPPSKSSTNLRKWSIAEYANALGRKSGSWGGAIIATTFTCGLGTVLTGLVPGDWSTIIPVFTTGFEAMFLRFSGFTRTSQYTLTAAPFFQGGVCVHWGMRQVAHSPSLVLPPSAFFFLVLTSRVILDLHLVTVFRQCPEFHWARQNAVVSTTRLVQIMGVVLGLEYLNISVMRWVKPMAVLLLYSLSIFGVSMPAAYNVAFDNISRHTKTS